MSGPSMKFAANIYLKHAECEGCMDLFSCKIALVELLGISLCKKELASVLTSCCPHTLDSGVLTLQDFMGVFSLVRDSHLAKSDISEVYSVLDPVGKGYITESDFTAVLHSVAPQICAARGAEIFKSCDSYDIGKVRIWFYVS